MGNYTKLNERFTTCAWVDGDVHEFSWDWTRPDSIGYIVQFKLNYDKSNQTQTRIWGRQSACA